MVYNSGLKLLKKLSVPAMDHLKSFQRQSTSNNCEGSKKLFSFQHESNFSSTKSSFKEEFRNPTKPFNQWKYWNDKETVKYSWHLDIEIAGKSKTISRSYRLNSSSTLLVLLRKKILLICQKVEREKMLLRICNMFTCFWRLTHITVKIWERHCHKCSVPKVMHFCLFSFQELHSK